MKKTKKQRAVHRVQILKGLLNKLEASIDKDEYCVETMNQSLAIQRAFKSLDSLLLEKHLDCCVKGRMKNDKESEKIRKELLELFSLSKK
jgi:DNA-binding FrmR family transcriptional regulator